MHLIQKECISHNSKVQIMQKIYIKKNKKNKLRKIYDRKKFFFN